MKSVLSCLLQLPRPRQWPDFNGSSTGHNLSESFKSPFVVTGKWVFVNILERNSDIILFYKAIHVMPNVEGLDNYLDRL